MAFLSYVKSNNTVYVYLKEYKRSGKYDSTTYNYVYSFGRIDKAQEHIEMMIQAYDILFPEKLKAQGYN
uniref:hypothetical protein n=1 Tax=Piscibacillus halophilus TaxID=571933 RepID=UPI001588BF0B